MPWMIRPGTSCVDDRDTRSQYRPARTSTGGDFPMKLINTRNIPEESGVTQGRFAGSSREISIAGRVPLPPILPPASVRCQCPRIPPGKSNSPLPLPQRPMGVLPRAVRNRHRPPRGRHFSPSLLGCVFFPWPHFTNTGTEDLVLYVVADNPVGGIVSLPDSNKWLGDLPSAGSCGPVRWTITMARSDLGAVCGN